MLLGAAVVLAAPAPDAEAKPRAKGAAPAVHFAAKRSAPTGCAAKLRRPACRRGWAPSAAARLDAAPLAPAVEAAPPAEEPATGAPVTPAPPPPATTAAPLCDPSPWIGVTAEDVGGFRLRTTRSCVPAGTVLFNFRNNDLSTHNLWAEGVTPAAAKRRVIDDTDGETVVTGSAQLSAGAWRLYCSLPGHEAMSRLVDVTPSS